MFLATALAIYMFFWPPQPLGQNDVLYYLSITEDPGFELLTLNGDISIEDIPLDLEKPLKIVVHGFEDGINITGNFYAAMREAYLTPQGGTPNVIYVDWSSRSMQNFLIAGTSVQLVGENLGRLILDILRIHRINPAKVHMIGFSLGAHIAGFAGKYMKRTNNITIGRITGLDPAGPGFRTFFSTRRLNSNDATFVDIIHTDRMLLGNGQLLGTADFFPNNGWGQNRCPTAFEKCNHLSAPFYYIETIRNNTKFLAANCNNFEFFQWNFCSQNVVFMGEKVNYNATGTYYLII